MPVARNARSIAAAAAISLCVIVVPIATRLAAEPLVVADAGGAAGPGAGSDAASAPGVEYVEYSSPYHPRNQFLVGGLLALMGLLTGGLAWMERRRVIGVSIGGGGLLIGLLLMFGLGG